MKKWNIVRNSEPNAREYSFSGKCPRFNKCATITILYNGRYLCKTDLLKTYHQVSFKCSLLEQNKEPPFISCEEDCPLVPEKFD